MVAFLEMRLSYLPFLFTVQSKMLVNKEKKQFYRKENKKFNKM